MMESQVTAEGLLQCALGANSEFRDGQKEAIESARRPGSRLLVVQRTGWGKSIVYFVATALNRSEGKGMTLILSPLLALMRNQIEMARKFGLVAATINSTNQEDWEFIASELRSGRIDVLFVSPERLANERFQSTMQSLIQSIGLLVIDEAHCISDWGHDFRPDYRRIVHLTALLPPDASILATTATATEAVVLDVVHQLGDSVEVRRGTILRESLRLSAFELPTHAERLAWLQKYLPRFKGSGIVYTLTVHDAEQVATYLNSVGVSSAAYHSEIPHEERLHIEELFGTNGLKAVVSTSALGMGYDKADVGFVVHYQLPPSILAYYQQIGRAGRMLPVAYACLLFSEGDQEIAEHFALASIPGKQVFDSLIRGATDDLQSASELAKGVKASRSQVLQALSILEVDGVLERKSGQYRFPAERKNFDFDHYFALQKKRLDESDEMLVFARIDSCRMQAVGIALGDAGVEPCGKCDNCHSREPLALDPTAIREADLYLRAEKFEIHPRIMLPATGESRGSKIPSHLQLESGLSLSLYNDSGYGRLVRECKYRVLAFGDDLVAASAEAIREANLNPGWVAAVPSLKNDLVPDLAARLANELAIPFLDCVKKVAENLPQKAMLFSQTQYENVVSAFEVDGSLPGKCLLIDDIVDSGWTLTVIGMKLRKKGSGPVIPFALATSRPRRQK